MIEGQGRPHHVLRRALPADADLSGQRLVVVVGEHAALRGPGRPPGVDESPEVGWPAVDTWHLGGRLEEIGPSVDLGPSHRRDLSAGTAVGSLVDHDDVLEALDKPDDLDNALDQVPFHDQDPGARILELVPQVLALVRRVDRDADGAAPHRSPPRQQRLR